MKQLLLIAIITISTINFAAAQQTARPVKAKKEVTITDSTKINYVKFRRISESDLAISFQALENWQRLTIYDPKLSADDKINMAQQLEMFIMTLRGRTPIDSAKILPPKK